MSDSSTHDQVVILGAARALRTDLPPALVSVDGNDRVMDWLLSAFAVLNEPEIHFVSGYKTTEVQRRYPRIGLVYNAEWQSTGPAGSLSLVPLSAAGATWVSYSDVVFRPATVRRLQAVDADVALAIDRSWRERYDGRSRVELEQAEKVQLESGDVRAIGKRVALAAAEAELVGVMRLSGRATALLIELLKRGALSAKAALPEVATLLVEAGMSWGYADVDGDWAELNAPQDLSRFVLGTKAESLARLKPLLRSGTIGELVSFDLARWREGRASVLSEIRERLANGKLIVRSSALSEDTWTSSSAGAYESVADVDGADGAAVGAAIEEVFASYGEAERRDQVLVQNMLSDIECSGVVMTRTPNAGAPYMVISFDDKSRRTDTVTAGIGDSVRTVFVHRDHELRRELPSGIHRLRAVIAELEELVGHDSLDVEFACTPDGGVHIFQVRPIALSGVDEAAADRPVAAAIAEGKRFFAELQKPPPFVVGDSTQLSVMSDWNPAEIIGTKPRRLAFSLYRYIITDEVWATQRAEYGCRDVRPCNLIVDVLGHPFVDVRATFNSFVPAELDDAAAARLVNDYLGYLAQHPELHDKVEFAVLFTCMTFDFEQQAAQRLAAVLSGEEMEVLRRALVGITRRAMERCAHDFVGIDEMSWRFAKIDAADLPPLERAYALLEDLRRIDTLRFSHLARAGFVAASLLRTLPHTGVVTESCESEFVASLETVSGALQRDAGAVAAGEMEWEVFVAEYGHLRPGTYDITSPCYASAPDLFLRPAVEAAGAATAPPAAAAAAWDEPTCRGISEQLEKIGLDGDVERFRDFLATAIEGRELCKFVFSRKLSAALEALAELAAECGIERDRLAHVAIDDIFALRAASTGNMGDALERLAVQGEEAYRVTESLCLPGQIFSADDFGCFEQLKAIPNFVSSKTVRAPIVVLSAGASPEIEVEERIVVIPNADPGFDWLFSRRITGLVTMHGGGNSHMAIRAAEFGLPAAIGVGELLYQSLAQAEVVELDCAGRQIRVAK